MVLEMILVVVSNITQPHCCDLGVEFGGERLKPRGYLERGEVDEASGDVAAHDHSLSDALLALVVGLASLPPS